MLVQLDTIRVKFEGQGHRVTVIGGEISFFGYGCSRLSTSYGVAEEKAGGNDTVPISSLYAVAVVGCLLSSLC